MENTALKMFADTVKYERSLIWIKPVCELFQINAQNQQRKIKNNPLFQKLWTNLSTDLGEIDKNGRILFSKNGFLMWILSINASTVSDESRENFIKYQTLISAFLFGSNEEHDLICKLNKEIQDYKMLYSEVGNQIRKKQKQLIEALNQRYQYSIDFKQPKAVE